MSAGHEVLIGLLLPLCLFSCSSALTVSGAEVRRGKDCPVEADLVFSGALRLEGVKYCYSAQSSLGAPVLPVSHDGHGQEADIRIVSSAFYKAVSAAMENKIVSASFSEPSFSAEKSGPGRIKVVFDRDLEVFFYLDGKCRMSYPKALKFRSVRLKTDVEKSLMAYCKGEEDVH